MRYINLLILTSVVFLISVPVAEARPPRKYHPVIPSVTISVTPTGKPSPSLTPRPTFIPKPSFTPTPTITVTLTPTETPAPIISKQEENNGMVEGISTTGEPPDRKVVVLLLLGLAWVFRKKISWWLSSKGLFGTDFRETGNLQEK